MGIETMLRWTWKALLAQRAGLWGSATGVAGAFLLVIAFDAIFTGESEHRHSAPDVWVMQPGVANMHMASSFVWDTKIDRVAEVGGVKAVTPIVYLNTVIRAGGRDWFCYVVGLESGQRRGGPWEMTAGRSDPAPGEAVIPNVLSELTGVGIGEDLFVTNRKLRVVGLSGGTFSMGNPVIFAHASDVAKLLSQFGTVSYLLVDALEGVEATVLARRIEEEVEKVHAMPQEEFIDSDYQIAIQMGAEIVALMSVICSALAVLIVAFISYTQVVHRRRELAIAKALGVSNRTIYVSVLFQTAVITGLAFLLANIVAWLVLPLIAKLMPMVTLVVTVDSISRIGMIAVLTGGVAALIPAYSVARVDPVAAFSS
jgi:ABC-type antimicrobial peptide transport system permease subunit